MDEQERNVQIQSTFNTVASGYDCQALRYFADSARHLASALKLNGDEHVLDVATGTGCVALKLARRLPDDRFDAATCAYGVFFVEDMVQLLRGIADKVKVGGGIAFTCFYDTAFLPLAELFFDRIQGYGIDRPNVSWKRLGTEDKVGELCAAAGLANVDVERKSLGYYLKDADEWWDVLWYAGFRGMLNQLEKPVLERFKAEHLGEIQALATEQGIWFDVDVLFAVARKQ